MYKSMYTHLVNIFIPRISLTIYVASRWGIAHMYDTPVRATSANVWIQVGFLFLWYRQRSEILS